MRQIGFADAAVTAAGTDGGVDVRSAEAVAQVKARATATSRPELQQLYGVARAEGKAALFYSLGSYTQGAIDWAKEVGVALFVLESTGSARPVNTSAEQLVLAAKRPEDGQRSQGDSPPRTFGAMLDKATERGSDFENLLVHLGPGPKAAEHGRALAQLVSSATEQTLRIIGTTEVGTGPGLPIRLVQSLRAGDVVYLDQVEKFPGETLPLLLAACSGQLALSDTADTIRDLWGSVEDIPTDELLGQVREADKEERPAPHTLLVGGSGQPWGRFVSLVCSEMASGLRVSSARQLKRGGDLAALVAELQPGDILVIERADLLSDAVQAMLAECALFRLEITLGSEPTARRVTLELPRFTLMATAPSIKSLSPAVQSVFGHIQSIESSAAALARLARNVWQRAGVGHETDAAQVVANQAAGHARRALHLARFIADSASGHDSPLSAARVAALLDGSKFDDDDWTEIDWLLLGWGSGTAIAGLSDTGHQLPKVTVIASTSIPWARGRDARDALGPLSGSFAATLAMPEIRSVNETMLRWELGDVPLFR